jgi:iron complex outermembrane recepter protein
MKRRALTRKTLPSLLARGAFGAAWMVSMFALGPGALAQQASTAAPAASDAGLGEIIVTATKRDERLIDIPQSVSVVSGDALTKMGAVQFSDWANSVPGLTFTTQGAGFSQIALRGVTTGNDIGSTVATYVDDVPFGNSTPGVNSGNFTFDPGLFDIDRIEVLRGPQGTLYGASTLGGLIKYVSPTPSSTDFAGHVQSGISDNEKGGVSYNESGAVNVPLISGLAGLRLSAFYTHDGGYIDNVTLGESNVNRSGIWGGRLDLMLTPVDGLSIRLNYFSQDISRDGQATADYAVAGSTPLVSPYDQERKVEEPFDQQFRLVSANVAYDFGLATLRSISSYQTQRTQTNSDASGVYAAYCGYVGVVCAAAEVPNRNYLNKFTQEVRLASDKKGPFEWTLGGFYTREVGNPFVGITGLNAANQPVAILLSENLPSLYEERAGFGDLTYHVTNKFDITGGIRYTSDHQTEGQDPSTGPFGSVILPRPADETAKTYLGNARYHFTDDDTLYLRYATGYRPGGPTVFSSIGPPPPGTPNSYAPDQLKSYEVGYKSEFLDRRFAVDLDAYRILWSDIHDTGDVNGFEIVVNSGNAAITGSELSFTARATQDLTIQGSLTYEDAYLVSPNKNLGGYSGERLPNVPRYNLGLSADYNIPVGDLSPSIGISVRKISDRYASFDNSATYHQYFLPTYTNVDVHASVAILQNLKLQFFVRNLTNRVEQQSAFTEYSAPGQAEVALLAPRTYGMNANYAF